MRPARSFLPCVATLFLPALLACIAAGPAPVVESYARLPLDDPESPKVSFDQWIDALRTKDVSDYSLLMASSPEGFPISSSTESGLAKKLGLLRGSTYQETIIASPPMTQEYSRLHHVYNDPPVAFVHLVDSGRGGAWTVSRVLFIMQDGKWKFYPTGLFGWQGWSISLRTPRRACESLHTAIRYHDWRSVFEMIDPRMRDGVDVRAFQAEVLRRWDELASWEKQPVPQLDPMQPVKLDLPTELIPSQRPPVSRDKSLSNEERKLLDEWSQRRGDYGARMREARLRSQHPPPYMVWSNLLEPEEERAFSASGRRYVVLFDADSFGPVRSEQWVVRDGRWYWQPRKEYTLWPYLKYDDE